MPLPEGIR